MREKIVLVWLKRDLRISDHEPFAKAIQTGLPIYAFYLREPKLLQCADVDERHIRFIRDSLEEMNRNLKGYHGTVHIHNIDSPEFFRRIQDHYEVVRVFSHQETGNKASFDRDIAVSNILKNSAIPWIESKPSYIIRGLKSGRMAWKEKWKSWMEAPISYPHWNKAREKNLFILKSLQWNREDKSSTFRDTNYQLGGMNEAGKLLDSFLELRYKKYSGCISKPEESRTHCSRLSPYLAWGNISAREVYQKTMNRRNNLNLYGKRQLDRFISRLAWRDHMIQKFESECRIEFENFNPGYDTLKHERKEDWIRAWEGGNTGFPLIDASMRCLVATGYLNFRMRAMLVSFFTMILWQDWRWGVHHMARQFLDYEPGIHFFQFQMQASTVGNHQIRIYNPYKQILDNDPECIFIKKWIPELAEMPIPDILNWGKEQAGLFTPRSEYPQPILDFKKAYNKARDIMFRLQKSPEVKKNLTRIREIHVVDRRNQSFR